MNKSLKKLYKWWWKAWQWIHEWNEYGTETEWRNEIEYKNETEWRHENEYRNETECSLDGNEGTNQCIIGSECFRHF